MLVDLSVQLHNPEWKPFIETVKKQNGDQIDETPTPVMAKHVCVNSLLREDEKQNTGLTSRCEKYELIDKIQQSDSTVELLPKEIAMIKDAVNRWQPLWLVGQIVRLLTPAL